MKWILSHNQLKQNLQKHPNINDEEGLSVQHLHEQLVNDSVAHIK